MNVVAEASMAASFSGGAEKILPNLRRFGTRLCL
jgi:hypothetical protein